MQIRQARAGKPHTQNRTLKTAHSIQRLDPARPTVVLTTGGQGRGRCVTRTNGLVLWAQTRGALATVAALRESSVVVAAGLGVMFFDEPMGRLRVLASAAVATGVVLLAVP